MAGSRFANDNEEEINASERNSIAKSLENTTKSGITLFKRNEWSFADWIK